MSPTISSRAVGAGNSPSTLDPFPRTGIYLKYRIARQTAWRTIADETIVLNLASKRIFGLNKSAAFIWQTVDTMDSFDSVLEAMASGAPAGESLAFGVEEIASFCDELVAFDLLEAADPEETGPRSIEPPAVLEPPRILWQETLERVAASCAFFPAQNPLCNQVPFS